MKILIRRRNKIKKRLSKKLEKKYYKSLYQKIIIANLFAQTIVQAQCIINKRIVPKSNNITSDYSKMPFVTNGIIQTEKNYTNFIDLFNRDNFIIQEDDHKKFKIVLDKVIV
jgi:hypothetical protein